MPTITLEMLKDANACREQYVLFKRKFGESVEVTEELAAKHAGDFDFVFAARHFLSDCEAYLEARAPLWESYNDARAPLLKAYEDAVSPLWESYNVAKAPLWKTYNDVRAPLREAYLEAVAPLLKAHEEAVAKAFARLYISENE